MYVLCCVVVHSTVRAVVFCRPQRATRLRSRPAVGLKLLQWRASAARQSTQQSRPPRASSNHATLKLGQPVLCSDFFIIETIQMFLLRPAILVLSSFGAEQPRPVWPAGPRPRLQFANSLAGLQSTHGSSAVVLGAPPQPRPHQNC